MALPAGAYCTARLLPSPPRGKSGQVLTKGLQPLEYVLPAWCLQLPRACGHYLTQAGSIPRNWLPLGNKAAQSNAHQ